MVRNVGGGRPGEAGQSTFGTPAKYTFCFAEDESTPWTTLAEDRGFSRTSVLLDPTGELEPARRQPLPKPASLAGLTVGLLDISKSRGDLFLNRLDELFAARGVQTPRFKKPTFTRPAPVALRQEIASRCAVVEGLAD